jgi:hypothetical protein
MEVSVINLKIVSHHLPDGTEKISHELPGIYLGGVQNVPHRQEASFYHSFIFSCGESTVKK